VSSKKPWERNLQVEDATPPTQKPWERDYAVEQQEQAKEPETSKLGAVGLGAVQGLTFGFADEVEAAARSALGDETYQQAVEEARKKYKQAQEDRPYEYGGAELATGVVTTFIPGVGLAGRVAQAGGKALGGAIAAKRAIEAGTKGARAIQAAATGAIGGGLGAVGTSEADVISKQTLGSVGELAADVGTGATLGAGLGAGLSRIADSDVVQKAGKAISESKVGQAAKDLRNRILSGGKENVEEGKIFIGSPEKVEEIEKVIKAGGKSKRIEEADKNVKELIKERKQAKSKLKKEENAFKQKKSELSQEISDLDRKEGLSIQTEQQVIREQTAGLSKEKDDVIKTLTELEPKIDESQKTIKTRVEQLGSQLDDQSAKEVQKLYDKQLADISEISTQRDRFVNDTLSGVKATESDAQQLQDAITDMYSIYKDDFETAIKPVFRKIMRDDPRFVKMANIIETPDNLPALRDELLSGNYSKADVVKLVENAKKNLYTSDVSTPMGKARRDAYQILNEKMSEISPDYKQFNSQINKLMTTRDVLEQSPLMENRIVTQVGRAGGETAAPQAFAKTQRADLKKFPPGYLDELQSKGFDTNLLVRQEDALENALTTEQLAPLKNLQNELKLRSTALQRQINDMTRDISIKSGEERIKLKQMLDKKKDDLNIYQNRMTAKLTKAREDLADKYSEKLDKAKELFESTKEQVRQERIAYANLRGKPISEEEIAKLGIIAAQTKAPPFLLGRLLPSPMAKIKTYNAIAKTFQNPALTAAISPRIGQVFTREDIMSLANTHGVDPNELVTQLRESGETIE
jgi:hypothetical protein